MYSIQDRALIAWKWLLSFRRGEWMLDNYPVRLRKNGENTPQDQAWVAQILNWPGPRGTGTTKQEATGKLREDLEQIRAHRRITDETMPRPGQNVPIEFASTERVSADPTLRDNFITRVLDFEPSDVWISDDSALSDFGDEAHVASLRDRILQVYGVDVSDLRNGLLCDILERIKARP